MARTVDQPSKAIKDDVGDLEMHFSMGANPADPDNIVASDAHVRMPIRYSDGSEGTSKWYRVVDIGSLSVQQKQDLRTIAKAIRDHIHTDIGASGSPDDV